MCTSACSVSLNPSIVASAIPSETSRTRQVTRPRRYVHAPSTDPRRAACKNQNRQRALYYTESLDTNRVVPIHEPCTSSHHRANQPPAATSPPSHASPLEHPHHPRRASCPSFFVAQRPRARRVYPQQSFASHLTHRNGYELSACAQKQHPPRTRAHGLPPQLSFASHLTHRNGYELSACAQKQHPPRTRAHRLPPQLDFASHQTHRDGYELSACAQGQHPPQQHQNFAHHQRHRRYYDLAAHALAPHLPLTQTSRSRPRHRHPYHPNRKLPPHASASKPRLGPRCPRPWPLLSLPLFVS